MQTFSSPRAEVPETSDNSSHTPSTDISIPNLKSNYVPFGIRPVPLIMEELGIKDNGLEIRDLGTRVDEQIEKLRIKNNLIDSKESFQEIYNDLLDKLCLSPNTDPNYILTKLDKYFSLINKGSKEYRLKKIKEKRLEKENIRAKKIKQMKEIAKQREDKRLKDERLKEEKRQKNLDKAREVLGKVEEKKDERLEIKEGEREMSLREMKDDLLKTRELAKLQWRPKIRFNLHF